MVELTFDSASDEDEAIFVNLPNVPRVQPSLIINGRLSLLLIVQVSHEHVTTFHTNLPKNKQTSDQYLLLSLQKEGGNLPENSPPPLHSHQADRS